MGFASGGERGRRVMASRRLYVTCSIFIALTIAVACPAVSVAKRSERIADEMQNTRNLAVVLGERRRAPFRQSISWFRKPAA